MESNGEWNPKKVKRDRGKATINIGVYVTKKETGDRLCGNPYWKATLKKKVKEKKRNIGESPSN